MSDVQLIRRYDMADRDPRQDEHDYDDVPNITVNNLSEFSRDAVTYIAGSVGRMTASRNLCKTCCDALGSSQHMAHTVFLKSKDRGGLFKPTQSLISICLETETRFRRLLNSTDGNLPRGRGISGAIATSVLADISLRDIFPELNGHMLDTSVTDNHVFHLIKTINKNYCKI